MTTASAPAPKYRIESIDILRGLIMLIMALDHTRDFFHLVNPLSSPTNVVTTTPILFFTRWVTHFCAPNFVFLSGISAYLAGTKRTKKELSAFLIKRGLWLILVELVFVTFAITFNPSYSVLILAVIWAIGFSMILVGLLVRAPLMVLGIIGGIIVFGHDILDFVPLPKTGGGNVLMNLFFTAFGSVIPLSGTRIILDLYAVLPWTGVMLLGYVFGSLHQKSVDPLRRKKILLITGASLIVLFIVLRYLNIYGDPAPWSVQRNWGHTLISFLNTSKYPPSLLFLCMTIGPAIIALALTENLRNKITGILIVYGNVPFFYYILHLYLLRVINVVLFFALGFHTNQISDPNSISLFKPQAFGFSLGVVYLIWFLVIAALYLPCRWFSRYKKVHYQWWLSYL
jgi:uncharacterized membrane protein